MYGEGYFERGEGSNYVCYGDDPGWGPTAGVLVQHLPPDASLCEVGCAKGFFVRKAAEYGLDSFGFDVSAYAVEAGLAQGDGDLLARIRVADICDDIEQVSPWQYDAVVSWEVLEHIPESSIDRVHKNLDLLTKPGGLQVHRIAVFNPEQPEEFYSDSTHVLPWERRTWEQWFTDAGYQRVSGIEAALDEQFVGRDWHGRFFAYRKQNV